MKFPWVEWLLTAILILAGMFVLGGIIYLWYKDSPDAPIGTFTLCLVGLAPWSLMLYLQARTAYYHTQRWRARRP